MSAKQMGGRIQVVAMAALLAGGAAVAQNGAGGMGQQPEQQQQTMPGEQPGQRSYPEMGGASNAQTLVDEAFVRSVFESDAAEVRLGQLAQQKSESDDVKQFGAKIAAIRQELDSQMAPIAKSMGVKQPDGPSKKDKQLLARLETLSGPQFDEEYIRAVAKDHQKTVKGMKSAAESAQDPNVQQAAKVDGPAIEQHLRAIEQIAQTHNVTLEEAKK